MTRYDEYRYLLERSRRFYETTIMQIDESFYDLAFLVSSNLYNYFSKHVFSNSVLTILELIVSGDF